MKYPKLKPCPCCKGKAKFGVITAENSKDYGAEFIACLNLQCGLSTPLMTPCMDEVKTKLAEIWNHRAK